MQCTDFTNVEIRIKIGAGGRGDLFRRLSHAIKYGTEFDMERNSRKMNPHMLGILLVIVDSFFFSLMTVFVRLSGDLPVMQKAFFRNAIAAVIAILTLARTPEKFHIKKGSLPFLILRASFGGVGLILNFWAIDHIGLADANILNKMSPFFAILASILILSEMPNVVEIITVIIAFIGAAFVVKPTGGAAALPALAGLASGFGAGVAYTFVRKLGSHGERGPVIVAFFSVFTCAMTLPFVIVEYKPMTLRQWLCLIGAGCVAAIAQFAVTAAYKLAPAKEISVFDYSQVMFASLWGVLLFSEVPDHWSIIGYVIIIGMAVFKWHYNVNVLGKEEKAGGKASHR
jgi:drug/metabolite transporter (DMT)-like permease